MKSSLFLAVLLFVAFHSASQVLKKKPRNDSVSVHGRLLLANVGFAPIPAFSFNSPVFIGFLSVKKKRFSYEPDFALGLNGNPWLANNWFRYVLAERARFKLKTGVNPSLFFTNEHINSTQEIVHAHRNVTVDLAVTYQFSEKTSLTLTCMSIHAFDKGALSGNFFDVTSTMTILNQRKIVKVNFKPQLFYFNFENNLNGLFTSATAAAELQKIPLSFYYQTVVPLQASFDTKLKWNIGLICHF